MLNFIVGNFTLGKILKKLSRLDWFLICILVIGIGLTFTGLFRGIKRDDQVQVEYLSGGNSKESEKKIFVDVEGGVVSPGVYEISFGSRVKDAMAAAGGLSEKADRDFVSQTLNMAEEVKDGRKIFIPSTGIGVGAKEMFDAQVRSNKINVNKATKAELDTLWGVGDSRADAIIKGRPYEKVEDLVSRKILSQQIFDRNKEMLSVF